MFRAKDKLFSFTEMKWACLAQLFEDHVEVTDLRVTKLNLSASHLSATTGAVKYTTNVHGQ
jgi:hypothetical protein